MIRNIIYPKIGIQRCGCTIKDNHGVAKATQSKHERLGVMEKGTEGNKSSRTDVEIPFISRKMDS
jgi:hypothetical protein